VHTTACQQPAFRCNIISLAIGGHCYRWHE